LCLSECVSDYVSVVCLHVCESERVRE
jgi:hypothetical protein